MAPLSSVSFQRKISFSAGQDLCFTRGEHVKLPEPESQIHAWSIKPPDFSVKLYTRSSESRKKARKTRPAEDRWDQSERTTGGFLPKIMYVTPKRKVTPEFVTRYKPPDALETELSFVKTGKFHCGPYKNPKPHNFRPLDEFLPDVITAYEKDPGNLHLRLKYLDTLRTTRSETDVTSRDASAQMDTFKPAEPKWDPEFVLPLLPWPPKSASFTRHRRRRGAYSAFLDRVEEKLCRSWAKK